MLFQLLTAITLTTAYNASIEVMEMYYVEKGTYYYICIPNVKNPLLKKSL